MIPTYCWCTTCVHFFVCVYTCLCVVYSRVCSWKVPDGTVRKCYWLNLFPRSSTTVFQSSGFVRARRRSLKHVQSTSALCIRPVPDVAYLAPPDIRPTSLLCWKFRRSIRSGTGSTEESLRSVSSTINRIRRHYCYVSIR